MGNKLAAFRAALREFYSQNPINKPWLSDRDPYKIWLLEVIAQQTRMEQAMPYFISISTAFPDIQSLAKATEDELFVLWKGLGYYSRARNLHCTAKFIVDDLKGKFPDTYADLLKLKGVGEYTAAAIASFAFDEKTAVLDGNVHRVLSRVYGIDKTIQNQADKRYFQSIANELIFEKEPALFNQLMMNLGSEVCKPQNPSCEICPMAMICVANKEDRTKSLPPPKIRPKLKNRYFYCLFVENKGKICLEKRIDNDIWKGLYQGIMQEGEEINPEFWRAKGLDITRVKWSDWKSQVLSHQKVWMKMGYFRSEELPFECMNLTDLGKMDKVAFPRVISKWWDTAEWRSQKYH